MISENDKKRSILYGIIYGATFSFILYLSLTFSLSTSILIILGLLGLVVSVLTVYFPIDEFKKKNNGILSFSQAIKTGLAVGLIGGLIYAFVTYLSSGFSDFDMATRNLIVMISKSFVFSLIIGLIKKSR